MRQDTTRLRRLIEDEVGACCDADVEERVETLDSLADELPTSLGADLAAMKALGDETRHRLARLLSAADGELCVCEFAPLVDVSESAISHALADLVDAGLVTGRRDGNWRFYRTTDRAERLVDVLDATRGTDHG